MISVSKTPHGNGWRWCIGQVVIAAAFPASPADPGLFNFTIHGVHRSAEVFSSHARAEALLHKHLGDHAVFAGEARPQALTIARDDRWCRNRPADPPEAEEDSYSYSIGNVFLGSLTNIKNIRQNGYHLYCRRLGAPDITKVMSVTEGERLLIQALECVVEVRRGGMSFVAGPNRLPAAADGFNCRPTLYDGRPAW